MLSESSKLSILRAVSNISESKNTDGLQWNENHFSTLERDLIDHINTPNDEDLRLSSLYYNSDNKRHYATIKSNKRDYGDYSFKLSDLTPHRTPSDIREEGHYDKVGDGIHYIGAHHSDDNIDIQHPMNESVNMTPHSTVIQHALNAARSGDRVVVNGKTVWGGLGNRSGLHSYANELIDKKWERSGNTFKKKMDNLQHGDEVEVHSFSNITRDRGRWNKQSHFTVDKGESLTEHVLNEAVIKKNQNGEDYIQFKCPGFNSVDTPKKHHNVMKKLVSTVDTHSQEFAGADVSKLISPTYHGNFDLYSSHHFIGKDGHTYRLSGVDTENWRGFSLRITKLKPENALKVKDRIKPTGKADIPDYKFGKSGELLRD